MNIPVYCAPSFRRTLWFAHTYQGIAEEARRRRYTLTVLDEIPEAPEDLLALYGGLRPVVIVMGMNASDTEGPCRRLRAAGIHTILVNLREVPFAADTSVLIMDYADATRQGMALLRRKGATRIALFGVLPDAGPDEIKRAAFLEAGGDAADIFSVEGVLSDACRSFLTRRGDYDGILFGNDIAAMALIRLLTEQGGTPPVSAGFVDADLTDFSLLLPGVISLSGSHAEFGRQAVRLCAFLEKEPSRLSAVVRLPLCILDEKAAAGRGASTEGSAASPFADPLAEEILRVERCLAACDETDRRLLSGESAAAAAEGCFLSERAARYRLRRSCDILGVSSYTELVETMRRWLTVPPTEV